MRGTGSHAETRCFVFIGAPLPWLPIASDLIGHHAGAGSACSELSYLLSGGVSGFLVLGGVFLCVTGARAPRLGVKLAVQRSPNVGSCQAATPEKTAP
jgi:hypothetical protein